MNNHKIKAITRTGILLAVMIGCIFGLGFTITGYLLEWGPGGGMNGPLWRILLVGIISSLAGAIVGGWVVKIMAKKMLSKQVSAFSLSLTGFLVVFTGSAAGFIVSWQVGFLFGKITGAIQGLEWKAVLLYTPAMAAIYSIPFCLASGVLSGLFVYFYLRTRHEHTL